MAANTRSVTDKTAKATQPQSGGYYTVETYVAEDSVGYLVAGLRSRLFRALDVALGKLGFTAAQWAILRAVADGETPTAAELCRQLAYDTGSMTRMLNRLAEKGVIAREPSEQDRRVVRLRITPAGRKLHPKLRDAVIRVLNQMVDGFSAADVRQVHEHLERMRSNLGAIDE